MAAMKEGIQPIIGCKLMLEDSQSVILLCASPLGYENLIQIVNRSYLYDESYKRTDFETLRAYHDGLIAIGSLSTMHLQSVFQDRFYLGLARYGCNAPDEDECIEKAYRLRRQLASRTLCKASPNFLWKLRPRTVSKHYGHLDEQIA